MTDPTGLDLDAYCARVGYNGPRRATAQVLRALAWCHPLAIAFENISVAAGKVPELSLRAIESKLVRSRRGGYCYEHNALFQAVLRAFGFEVTGLSARVRYRLPAELQMPRSHMVLCVELAGQRHLVDVGFGALTLTAPVLMDAPDPQATPHEVVRLLAVQADRMLQARIGDEWIDVYRFDQCPQWPVDYEQQNWHTATRPGSLFANHLIASRPAAAGRYALFNRTLSWKPHGAPAQRRELLHDAELRDALRDVFLLDTTDPEFAAAIDVSRRPAPMNPAFG